MKIMLICSQAQNIYNFRLPLIKRLSEIGLEVVTAGFDDKFVPYLKELGIEYYSLGDFYQNIGVMKMLQNKFMYRRLLQQIKPDIVFTFMTRPNIYGGLAAHSLGIHPIFSMVEGAGKAFSETSLKWRLFRLLECLLYRTVFHHSSIVFFLNSDDLNEFVHLKLVAPQKAKQLFGIGVDVDHFHYCAISRPSTSFVMVSRMIRSKGVMEYCKCAEIVRSQFPEARFYYLGAECDVHLRDIQPYIDNGSIIYCGTVKDIRPYLENCLCFVLPSYYREGMPVSIMEAEAIGRCVITTDNIGCRDTVENGYNGWLVPPKDVVALVERCCYALKNPQETIQMGINARDFAEAHFNQRQINDIILSEMDDILECSMQ